MGTGSLIVRSHHETEARKGGTIQGRRELQKKVHIVWASDGQSAVEFLRKGVEYT